MSPSRSIRASCWRGSTPFCGACAPIWPRRRPAAVTAFASTQWILDTRRRELLDPKGVVVDLSTGEYDLLLTFLEAPQRVLTREHLMDAAKHRMATGFDRAIDIQVSRLRRKIRFRRGRPGHDQDHSRHRLHVCAVGRARMIRSFDTLAARSVLLSLIGITLVHFVSLWTYEHTLDRELTDRA